MSDAHGGKVFSATRSASGSPLAKPAELLKLAEWARSDIGDYDRIGTGARFYDDEPKRPDIGKKR